MLDGAGRMHFDSSLWDVANVSKAQAEWERLQRATTQLLRSIKSVNGPTKEIQILSTIGMGLHALQDFYSHSNWIEDRSAPGTDGTDWSQLPFGLTPTWFDVPKEERDKLNVYIGESTGHEQRPHGAWNTDGNKTMATGVNKDWPGRAGYANAYTTSYFATRQWVQAIHAALGDEALWQRVIRYANRGGGELDHDLKGALSIGMMTGHWQGQGEPCDPGFSLNICGSRNGLGGDLIGARSAVNSYFEDRDRTRFRGTFQGLIPLFGQPTPNGDLLPIASSQGMQATTRFVAMRVTSMKGVGLRALGDPTPVDRADMYSRATIAGQSFQSGEINGRDSFSFPRPYAPFTFIKAIGVGGRYAEPVTTMTVEIRTSSKTFAGTDDDVYLRISPTLRFPLDKSLYDDFERGDRDTYSVPIDGAVLNGLKVGDISRVQIEKSPDGAAGGWRLRGVKLVVNGRTLYARDGIERWLEDDHRTWRAPDFRQSGPGGPALPITLDLYDEDSNVYGSDDHGDLNRYDNRRRLALAYDPGTTVSARATGGSYLSGRIGDGDKASVTYTIETLTPTARAPAADSAGPPSTGPRASPDTAQAAGRRSSARAQTRPRDHRDGLERDRPVLLHGQEPRPGCRRAVHGQRLRGGIVPDCRPRTRRLADRHVPDGVLADHLAGHRRRARADPRDRRDQQHAELQRQLHPVARPDHPPWVRHVRPPISHRRLTQATRRWSRAQAVQWCHQPRRPRLGRGLGARIWPRRRPEGAPNVLDRALRRHRAGRLVALRRADQHADDAAPRRRWADLHPVAHDRALLADALVRSSPAATTTQNGFAPDLRGRDRASRATAGTSRWRTRRWPRSCASAGWNTFWVGKNHNVPVDEWAMGALEDATGRWRAGFDRFYGFIGGETNKLVSRPRRGQPLHRAALPARGRLPPLQGPRRQGAQLHPRLQAVRSPTSPGTCGSARAPTTRRTTRPQEYIDKYKGKFDDGYEAYREWVLPRMIEKGILPEDTELTPINPTARRATWSRRRRGPAVGLALRRGAARCSARMAEVYAGYSEYTDAQVGRIVDYLEESGQLDNTIIFYCADNGASGEGSPNGSVNESKFFNAWPDSIERQPGDARQARQRPTPTTTTRPAGRRRSRRRTGCSSATPTRAASATRW